MRAGREDGSSDHGPSDGGFPDGGPSRRVLLIAAIGGVSAAAAAGIVSSIVRSNAPAARNVATNPSAPATIPPTATRAPGVAPEPLWTYDKARLTDSPPVPVSDSLVVVKGYAGLIGLDASSGHHLWTTANGLSPDGTPLATGDGLVADLSRTGPTDRTRSAQAVDPSRSGRTRWTLNAPATLRFPSDALLASDDTAVYAAAASGGRALVLSYTLGHLRERWRRAVGAAANGSGPRAALDRGRLVVCDGTSLASYDTRSGALWWRVPLSGAGNGRPAADDSRAYVAGVEITAVDLTSGRIAWRAGASRATTRYGDPAVLGDVVYAVERTAGVLALDASSGAELWRLRPDAPLLAADAPIAYRDRLYAVTTDDRAPLAVFDTMSRHAAWTFRPRRPTGGTVRAAALGDRLYVRQGNAVHALPMD